MAANLTPQYQKAERAYRQAQTAAEQVECLMRMLQLVPKHKGTEKLQADLKSRLSAARRQLQREQSGGAGAVDRFRIARQGAGRVVIVGPPNCGKSRILKELTKAEPEVSSWPFTTREPLPGMMLWNDIRVQLVDTPAITVSSLEPWMLNLVRTADAVLLVLDGAGDDSPDDVLTVCRELEQRGTRLSPKAGFDEDDLSVLHVRTLLVVTHAGDPEANIRSGLLREHASWNDEIPVQNVELDDRASVDLLADSICKLLNLVRVYTRRPGTEHAAADPVTIPRGGTVEDLALELHEDLFRSLAYAKVWGRHVFDGQIVGRQHVLDDGDVVELH